jgi:KUP system potassium uptake protein
VTGGEALYADLGHFGRKPIQAGWFYLVMPALLINYFGQGALVLSDPAAIENPFYRLVPEIMLLPLVVLATAATVIASQAVITGAFSLIRQAVQLGLLPRFEVRYTSETHAGQIYLPRVNRLLLIGVVLLVLLFRTSSGLASAYGIAVSTTMVVDGIMGFVVIWKLWNWRVRTATAGFPPASRRASTTCSAGRAARACGRWRARMRTSGTRRTRCAASAPACSVPIGASVRWTSRSPIRSTASIRSSGAARRPWTT